VALDNVDGPAPDCAEPIRNPITGHEHRTRSVLPEGFEYSEAEMADTVEIKLLGHLPLASRRHHSYRGPNAFEWRGEALTPP
jgi:hypothetical protein